MSDRRRPSAASVAVVVLVWLIGVPALLFVAAIVALGVGFTADAGGDGDATVAVAVVMALGALVLVSISVIVLGGLGDEPSAPPPRPYGGRPLCEVRSVSGQQPSQRRIDGVEGDTVDWARGRLP